MSFKNNKIVYYVFGGVLATGLIGGLYYFLNRKSKNIELSPWLEEYISEIQEKIKSNCDIISAETAAMIHNLIREVDDFFYLKENSRLESSRIKYIKNDEIYKEFVYITFHERDESQKLAVNLIEKKLNITLSKVDEVLSLEAEKFSQNQFDHNVNYIEKILAENRKLYPKNELPTINREDLIDAYITYSKKQLVLAERMNELKGFMNLNPDSIDQRFLKIKFDKTLFRDQLIEKYGIDEKYLEQLIFLHDLEEITEIKYYLQVLYYYDAYKTKMKKD